MDIEIKLKLSGHCIETEAKREFRRLTEEYISLEKTDKILEGRIELLREFLDRDFAFLRNSDIRFTGMPGAEIIIIRNDRGEIILEFAE